MSTSRAFGVPHVYTPVKDHVLCSVCRCYPCPFDGVTFSSPAPRHVDPYDEAIADVCAAITDDAWWRDEVTGGGGQQNLSGVRRLLVDALVAGTAKGKAKL